MRAWMIGVLGAGLLAGAIPALASGGQGSNATAPPVTTVTVTGTVIGSAAAIVRAAVSS